MDDRGTGDTGTPDWTALARALLERLDELVTDPAERDEVRRALVAALEDGSPGVLRRAVTSRYALREWVRTQGAGSLPHTARPPRADGAREVDRDGLSDHLGAPAGRGSGAVGQGPDDQRSTRSEDRRWLNAEVEHHDPSAPLELDRTVVLAVDVDHGPRQRAVAASALSEPLWPEDVDEVSLTVQLDTDDFTVDARSRPMRLPRTGPSPAPARFAITPRRAGRCFLSATVHHDGNFLQKLDIAVSVGARDAAPAASRSVGRAAAMAAVLGSRDLTLVIQPSVSGYTCTVIAPGAAMPPVAIPLQLDALADAVGSARRALMSVVELTDAAGDPVLQMSVDVAPEHQEAALRTLARAGSALFRKVFRPHLAPAELTALADHLQAAAGEPGRTVRLQVVAQYFPLPWAMLYLGDASDGATLDWAHFLGASHVIEQLPLRVQFPVFPQTIPSDEPDLGVGLTLNTAIDTEMRTDVVARQQLFWSDLSTARRGLHLRRRDGRQDLLLALGPGAEPEQVLYLYCHASAPDLGARGGLDAASIVLSDAAISLADLNLDAPVDQPLAGSPLVFINACESAEMSPKFYEGFVPYFISKGARGVIGTECKVPALFAAEWAQRFFERFFDGQPLGDAVLALRQQFLREHGNPLGLLYAVHCDGDTRVEPALATSTPSSVPSDHGSP